MYGEDAMGREEGRGQKGDVVKVLLLNAAGRCARDAYAHIRGICCSQA